MSKQYGRGFHDGRRKTRRDDLVVAGVALAIGAGIAAATGPLGKRKKAKK